MKRLFINMLGLLSRSKPIEQKNPLHLPMLAYLESLQEEGGLTHDVFGFLINYQMDNRYPICPIDAIPFASTIKSGIHFAFLTDFGLNKNMDQAPIICIAPAYDPPVQLVASHLHDFLSIVTTIEEASLLANVYKDQSDFEKRKEEHFKGLSSHAEGAVHRAKLIVKIRKDLKLKKIDDVVGYIHRPQSERENEVDAISKDGLGIKHLDAGPIEEFNYSRKPDDVQLFLSTTNRNSRLLFYRNAYYEYILTSGYDEKIKNILINHLIKDGFNREAQNLKLY